MRICEIDGCIEPHYCRGWCRKHYKRWEYYKDPLGHSTNYCRGTMTERIIFHSQKGPISIVRPDLGHCRIWTGALTTKGYAKLGTSRKVPVEAHKAAWEILYGPIPDGYQLHHLCEVKLCIEASHLALLTSTEHQALH